MERGKPERRAGSRAAPFDYERERARSGGVNAPPRGLQMQGFTLPTGAPAQAAQPRQAPKGKGGGPKKAPPKQQKRRAPQNSAPQRAPAGYGAPQNPQQAGYRPGAQKPGRRMTNSEKKRQRRRRAIIGSVLVLAALALGVVLSINLLFKVTDFKVENLDKTTPANTGIYTEQQIVDLLGVAVGDNLFGVSTGQKSAELAQNLPYLDTVQVKISMPGTVIVRIHPATERFKVQTPAGWLTLSDHLKILKVEDAEPQNLILLEVTPDTGTQPVVGNRLTMLAQQPATETAQADPATAEAAQTDIGDTLIALTDAMSAQNLLENASVISMTDLSEVNFLYNGRVSVKLGTMNNLEYKLRYAANIIFDQDGKGLAATDRGTLDVSYQRDNGDIWAYFNPAEPDPTPTPEPAAGDSAAPTAQ